MFELIAKAFHILLYQPLFNCLVLLYNSIPGRDFGIAIIILTVFIKLILYPTSVKAVESQRALQKLNPQIQDIQKKYKNDKERQAKEMLDLYKKEKINPFSGLLIQIPIIIVLIALYRVFWLGLDPKGLVDLYSFVHNPGQINPLFLHIVDLSKPNLFFAILSGITQYFQTNMLLPKSNDPSHAMQKQMVYFMPVFTVIILINLPSALGLYWTISGIFSIIQQYLILKKNNGTIANK